MRLFVLAIAVSALIGLNGRGLFASDLYIGFWNVENLFDVHDDKQVEKDEEFTPSGPKKWNIQRKAIKQKNLVRVIRSMNDGRGPDVLGLCEIENVAVLKDLVLALTESIAGRDYRIVHQDSPSFRGIDCALVYDATRFKLTGSRFHRINGMTTRDIVEGTLETSGQRLTVFVNHWPSRFNPEDARITVARVLRKRIDAILTDNRAAEFMVIGDLNDTPVNKSVGTTLRTWSDPDDLRPGVLLNTTWALHKDPQAGTYVYNNKWDVLDHIIVSPGLVDQRGLAWVRGSTQTIRHDYQMYVPKRGKSIPRPSRSYTGNSFHENGFSDHLPIGCRLRLITPSVKP